jgi:hypothetical protein
VTALHHYYCNENCSERGHVNVYECYYTATRSTDYQLSIKGIQGTGTPNARNCPLAHETQSRKLSQSYPSLSVIRLSALGVFSPTQQGCDVAYCVHCWMAVTGVQNQGPQYTSMNHPIVLQGYAKHRLNLKRLPSDEEHFLELGFLSKDFLDEMPSPVGMVTKSSCRGERLSTQQSPVP